MKAICLLLLLAGLAVGATFEIGTQPGSVRLLPSELSVVLISHHRTVSQVLDVAFVLAVSYLQQLVYG